jgi:hypothetical protein
VVRALAGLRESRDILAIVRCVTTLVRAICDAEAVEIVVAVVVSDAFVVVVEVQRAIVLHHWVVAQVRTVKNTGVGHCSCCLRVGFSELSPERGGHSFEVVLLVALNLAVHVRGNQDRANGLLEHLGILVVLNTLFDFSTPIDHVRPDCAAIAKHMAVSRVDVKRHLPTVVAVNALRGRVPAIGLCEALAAGTTCGPLGVQAGEDGRELGVWLVRSQGSYFSDIALERRCTVRHGSVGRGVSQATRCEWRLVNTYCLALGVHIDVVLEALRVVAVDVYAHLADGAVRAVRAQPVVVAASTTHTVGTHRPSRQAACCAASATNHGTEDGSISRGLSVVLDNSNPGEGLIGGARGRMHNATNKGGAGAGELHSRVAVDAGRVVNWGAGAAGEERVVCPDRIVEPLRDVVAGTLNARATASVPMAFE